MDIGHNFSANSATSYPFSWDGRRLTWGKHHGKRFWDVTALDTEFGNQLVTTENLERLHHSLREYRTYLIDRGFPFVQAPDTTDAQEA